MAELFGRRIPLSANSERFNSGAKCATSDRFATCRERSTKGPGIKVDPGLDEGEAGEDFELIRLTQELYRALWSDYASDDPSFDGLCGEPVPRVLGTSNGLMAAFVLGDIQLGKFTVN